MLAGSAVIDDVEAAFERGVEGAAEILQDAGAFVIGYVQRFDAVEPERVEQRLGICVRRVAKIGLGFAGQVRGDGVLQQFRPGRAPRHDPALPPQHQNVTRQVVGFHGLDQAGDQDVGQGHA